MLNGEDQPCQGFEHPKDSDQEYWGSGHQCPECSGLRWFCGNCHYDHHEGGWKSCREQGESHD